MPSWFTGWPTRFMVTDLYGVTTTWLDKLTLSASLTVGLNLPFTGSVSVRPNDPRVNGLFTDGYPRLAQSNRLVYIFFDETPPGGWVCRLAGTFMSPEDQADADVPTTHFAFWDAWQFLNGTPVFDGAGNPPGPNGYSFYGIRGNVIVGTVLKNAIDNQPPLNPNQGGNGYFIDAGPSYGGTAFWGGTIENTPIIDYTVQQGQTVGAVWTDLLAAGADPAGGSGGVDIVLTAICDPVNRPGYTHELSIYNLAGIDRPYTPMSWGKLNRTSITADRQHDATPGSFINVAKGYAGQGGPGNAPVVNTASVNDFLYYWAQQWFPNQPDAVAVQAMMHQLINLSKQGKRTFTLNPDPLRARQPFLGYNIGDRIPVNAPNSLRVVSAGYQRVQTIPLEVNPDGVTRVNALITSPDWRGDSVTPPPPGSNAFGIATGYPNLTNPGSSDTPISGPELADYFALSETVKLTRQRIDYDGTTGSTTDAYVNAAIAAGQEVLIIIGISSSDDGAAYAARCTTCVDFYKDRVSQWELGNEPNLDSGWANGADYAAVAAVGAAAVVASQPSATVLLGGISNFSTVDNPSPKVPTNWLQSVYDFAGPSPTWFNHVAYHPYGYFRNASGAAALANPSGWPVMFDTSPCLQSVMDANGDTAKLIYATEHGAPTWTDGSGGESDWSEAAFPSDQGMFLDDVADFIGLSLSDWVTRPRAGDLYLYSSRDRVPQTGYSGNREGHFGVLQFGDLSLKPSYAVVAAFLA